MKIIHGFELQREQSIRELKTHARFYRHAKTGAELLSLSNEDENKVFGGFARVSLFDLAFERFRCRYVIHARRGDRLCGQ